MSVPNLKKNCSLSNLTNFEKVGNFGEQKLNKEAAVSNITKQYGELNSTKEFGGSNSNKVLTVSNFKRGYNAFQTRVDPRTMNRDFGSKILYKETDSPNSSMDFRKRGFKSFKYNYGF